MWSVVKDWGRMTTMHGPSDVVAASNVCTRGIWVVAIVVAAFAMVLNVNELIRAFGARENWTTSVTEQREDDGVPFPFLTLCNFNRIAASRAAALNLSLDAAGFLFYTMGSVGRYPLSSEPSVEARADMARWLKAQNASITDVWDRLGHTCLKTISRIGLIERRIVDGDEACGRPVLRGNRTWLGVRPVFSVEFGRCFQISLQSNITDAGTGGGMSLILDSQYQDYLPTSENNYLEEGFAFQLTPTPAFLEGDWTTLEPSKHIMLKLQVTRRQLRGELDYQDSFTILTPPCITKHEQRLSTYPDSYYSRLTCEADCRRLADFERCGCLFDVADAEGFRACSPFETFACKDAWEHANASREERRAAFAAVAACKSACQDPCEETRLQPLMSTTRFPTATTVESLLQLKLSEEATTVWRGRFPNAREPPSGVTNLLPTLSPKADSQDELAGLMANVSSERTAELRLAVTMGYVSLNIYMSSLSSTVVEMYQRMSINDLFGQVGGVVGFFMGISILTILQTVAYFCRFSKSILTCYGVGELKEMCRKRLRR